MTLVQKSALVKFSALQMFELVNDIEAYPQFLPWCKKAKIIEKISEQNLRADLLINFKTFFEFFIGFLTIQ
jgi:ribosome-associated toxin RatA of RatAB toxin-antitoxin module